MNNRFQLVFKSKLFSFTKFNRQSAKDMYLVQAGQKLEYSLDIETRLSYDVMTL